jgi:hypothetical protein
MSHFSGEIKRCCFVEVRDDVPADDALHLLPILHVPLPAQGCGYVFRDYLGRVTSFGIEFLFFSVLLKRVPFKHCFGSALILL